MNRTAFQFLSTPAGRDLLARLAESDLGDTHTLALITALRREVPPEIAGAALSLARLRQRAAGKFSRADRMFFTADALEQASSEIVAAWRAQRFAEAGYARLADLGCGIGGDTLALAGIPGAAVIALDRDAQRLAMARANLAVYDRAARWIQADLVDPLPLAGIEAVFFDPARREAGRRVFSVRDTIPPLDVMSGWHVRALAVKLSPGVDLDDLRGYTDAGAGIEFVSLGGELKEAVLWRGELGFEGRIAARLEPDGSGESLVPLGLSAPPLAEPRAWLVEPDPAVIRAGLLGEMAHRLELALYRLDETIAYLTGDSWESSRWARAWPVWGWMPFHLKRLRAALRARGIGRVTVKKRGSAITPDDLIRQLRLDGEGDSAVVVLTRIAGQPGVILCGEMGDSGSGGP